jgi:hypothetical protein
MYKRYGDKAIEESAEGADELAAQDDYNGEAIWRRITYAVIPLANTSPPGPLHWRSETRSAAGSIRDPSPVSSILDNNRRQQERAPCPK